MKTALSLAFASILLIGQPSVAVAAKTFDLSHLTTQILGVAVNPANGHLFMTSGHTQNGNFWELSADGQVLRSETVFSLYGTPQGLTFAENGTLYAVMAEYLRYSGMVYTAMPLNQNGTTAPGYGFDSVGGGVSYDPVRDTVLHGSYGVKGISESSPVTGLELRRTPLDYVPFDFAVDPLADTLLVLRQGTAQASNRTFLMEYERNENDSLSLKQIHDLQGWFRSIEVDRKTGDFYVHNDTQIVAFNRSELTTVSSVPLPGILPLFAAGLASLSLMGRLKARRQPTAG